MNQKALCYALAAVLTIALPAGKGFANEKTYDRIQCTDGKVYESVTVKAVSVTHVKVFHRSGAAILDFRVLPEEVRTELGYDEDRANDKRRKDHRARQEALKRKRDLAEKAEFIRKLDESAHERRFLVIQVLPDGLLVSGMTGHTRPATDSRFPSLNNPTITDYYPNGTVHFIRLYPTDGLAKGDEISGRFARHGTYSYTSTDGAQHTVPQQIFTRKNSWDK